MTKSKDSRWIFIFMIALSIFGSFMIASAEMGNSTGDSQSLMISIIKQFVIVAVSILFYVFFRNFRLIGHKEIIYMLLTITCGVSLLLPLGFSATGGAHAWIKLGFISIQPSEFAKVFLIMLGAKLLGQNHNDKNKRYLYAYIATILIYALIIYELENDLGSAIVLIGISYCVMLVPVYKETRKIHNILIVGILLVMVLTALFLSPWFTEWCKGHTDNYMVRRFLAAADPFYDQYNSGYHLIMSLVSFATGGLTGTGYTTSIHKYMNFPNPSTDFILPVIVEEMGIISFIFVVCCYVGIMAILIKYSLKMKNEKSRIILFGTFMYFGLHFILNVGGVSGIIPLTGVPLLLLSSGGSSTLASMIALGICQAEIINYKVKGNENN